MKSLFLALCFVASAASAQQFSFDVSFNGCGGLCGQVVDLTGSFTDNQGAISNINIVDPGWGAANTQFSIGQSSKNGVVFYDTEGASSLAAAGSNVWLLSFGLDTPTVTENTEITSATYWHGGSGGIACGPTYGGYTCPVMTLTETTQATRAPEIGPNAEAFVLALGVLMLLKGRRHV